ncbi:hypothetical protein M8818_007312 [Zalaria obscura]|uniref:Uncharacterized protein n=1 Tax=Zalaria obscura TaxID=2024903 RepID=A0ACC3S4N1_9PEZI
MDWQRSQGAVGTSRLSSGRGSRGVDSETGMTKTAMARCFEQPLVMIIIIHYAEIYTRVEYPQGTSLSKVGT